MKKVQKILITLSLLFFIFAGVSSLTGLKANAASKYSTLPVNDKFIAGNIPEKGTANFYTITLKSAGTLKVTYQGWNIGDAYYELYNSDMTKQYFCVDVYPSTDQDPKTSFRSLKLEPGNYTLKVYGYMNHIGDYKVKASFTAAGNNETEPNNYFSNAMRLQQNHIVTGFLSEDDTIDFYTLNVPVSSTIRFTTITRVDDILLSVWNSDFICVKEKDIFHGSEENPKTNYLDVYLKAGTYYVKVVPYNGSPDNLGRYQIMWDTAPTPITAITVDGKNSIYVGEKTQLTAQIIPTAASNQTLTWTSNCPYIATVDANGLVTGIAKGAATITATANDGSGCYGSLTIVVNESDTYTNDVVTSTVVNQVKTVKAKKKSGKKVKISWKKQSNARKYEVQVSNNKNFKGSSTISIYVKSKAVTVKCKSKGKHYIRVRAIDRYGKTGKWSKTTKVKVK